MKNHHRKSSPVKGVRLDQSRSIHFENITSNILTEISNLNCKSQIYRSSHNLGQMRERPDLENVIDGSIEI